MPAATRRHNVRQADESPSQPPAARADDTAEGRTLRRGLQVLDAVLASGRVGQRVVDLCRQLELPRATVHRLLATLTEAGYVAPRARFVYGPGPRLAALANLGDAPNLAQRLQPLLAQVSAACGDAAFAIVRDGPHACCIARQVGTHPVQALVIQVGTRQPLGVGAAGLALLAALPEAERAAAIAANSPHLAGYGGMTAERLAALVRATQERGWSVVGNHATRGVLGVGLALHNSAGEPVAAISVASTLARMQRDRQHQIARLMREAQAQRLPRGL